MKFQKSILFLYSLITILSANSVPIINNDCGLIINNIDSLYINRLIEAGKYKEIIPTAKSLTYSLPYKFDISLDKAFPPIGKQKGPVCASYSSAYYNASYLLAKRDGIDLSSDSSKAVSPYYVYAMAEQSGKGIGGTSLASPMEVMVHHGCLTHEEWSMKIKNYNKRWNTNSNLWRKALKRRMKSVFGIYKADTPEGMNEIKRLLIDSTYAITVGAPDTKRGFEMRPLKSNPKAPENAKYPGETGCIWSSMGLGGHAMALVGYNDSIWLDVNDNNQIDDGEMGAWKIANSYGVEFPEIPSNKGLHWVSYDATRDSSRVVGLNTNGEKRVNIFLGNKVEGFQIQDKNYKPKVLAEITLKTAARMDPRITFYKTTTSDTPPFNSSNSWKTFIFGTKSGSQSNRIGFDAENYDDNPDNAPEGTFIFDITEHVPNNYTSPWRLGVSIQDKYEEKPVQVNSMKVIYLSNNGDIIFQSKIPPLTFDYDIKNLWVDIPGDETAIFQNKKNINNTNLKLTTTILKKNTISFSINTDQKDKLNLAIYNISGKCLHKKSLSSDTKTYNWNYGNSIAKQTFIVKVFNNKNLITNKIIPTH